MHGDALRRRARTHISHDDVEVGGFVDDDWFTVTELQREVGAVPAAVATVATVSATSVTGAGTTTITAIVAAEASLSWRAALSAVRVPASTGCRSPARTRPTAIAALTWGTSAASSCAASRRKSPSGRGSSAAFVPASSFAAGSRLGFAPAAAFVASRATPREERRNHDQTCSCSSH
jgi:hypothetical protein